jgi:type I restriction enzyme S subunit
MKRKSYPKYKPSGVEWLGEVPETWEVKKLKYVSDTCTGFAFSSDDYTDDGIPLIRIGDILQDGNIDIDNAKKLPDEYLRFYRFARIEKEDILMAMTGATIGKAGQYQFDKPGLLNQRVCKFVPNSIGEKYLWYILKSEQYLEHIKLTGFGGAQPNISDVQLLAFCSAFPPLPEQHSIAAFLDRETGRIDTLIGKKKKLVELLREKRMALISSAVTKGLNASVKVKPSGVEWLGEVPEHWVVSPIKRIVVTPVTDGPHETPEILDEGVPFVSAEAIRNNKIDFERKRGFISEFDHRRYSLKYHPKRDDIYMIKSGATTGNLAIVETDDEFNIWSPLAVIRVHKNKADAKFILSAMNSKEFQTSVQLFWSYGTQQNIGMNVIEKLPVPLPPLTEQQAIATFLDRETAKIDTLVSKVETAIEKLKEYRTALISAAVTGKIDIRKEFAV